MFPLHYSRERKGESTENKMSRIWENIPIKKFNQSWTGENEGGVSGAARTGGEQEMRG